MGTLPSLLCFPENKKRKASVFAPSYSTCRCWMRVARPWPACFPTTTTTTTRAPLACLMHPSALVAQGREGRCSCVATQSCPQMYCRAQGRGTAAAKDYRHSGWPYGTLCLLIYQAVYELIVLSAVHTSYGGCGGGEGHRNLGCCLCAGGAPVQAACNVSGRVLKAAIWSCVQAQFMLHVHNEPAKYMKEEEACLYCLGSSNQFSVLADSLALNSSLWTLHSSPESVSLNSSLCLF
eukprot:scaffold121814_cov21-Tisochrysis_lutea.AAC.1